MARNRFIKISLSGSIGFLNSTIAISLFIITGKDTILVIDNGSHQVALFIGINDSLFIYHVTCLGRQFFPNNRKYFFQLLHFIQFYRSAGIAFYTTFTFASIQIA